MHSAALLCALVHASRGVMCRPELDAWKMGKYDKMACQLGRSQITMGTLQSDGVALHLWAAHLCVAACRPC
eukprot:scaffold302221_cov21-Tisochrysis_lutea.AAC.2